MSTSPQKISVLERFAANEIGVSISFLPADTWNVVIGDPSNGFTDEAELRSWAEAEAWLQQQADRMFPLDGAAVSED